MKNPPELQRLYNLTRGAFEQKQYDRAISLAERYLDKVPEDTWALGMIHGALTKKLKRARSVKSKAELQEQIDAIQTRIEAKGEGSGIWLEQWNRAYALNGKAWSQYEAAKTKKALIAALKTIDQALEFTPYQLGYQDTRVRILLDLGREDEAFEIVRWVLALMPQQMDFQDHKSDRRYLSWLKERRGEQIRLPEGPATTGEVIPEPEESLMTTGGRLTQSQREHLLESRVGKDEWHRARNVALLTLLNNTSLDLDELLQKNWPDTNLSFGTLDTDGSGTIELDEASVLALRHYMLIDTCHKQFIKGHKNKLLIFKSWGFTRLTPASAAKILALIGDAVGISGLTADRFRRSHFRHFGGSILGRIEDGGRWTAVDGSGSDTDGLAVVISWPSRYDHWYVLYTIEVGDTEYGFVFETDCDEIHRGYSGGPEMWYDPLVSGACVAVRYCKDSPSRHRVTDERFAEINGRARFVGKARGDVRTVDDLEP